MTIRSTLDDLERAVEKGEKPNDLIEKARRLLERSGEDSLAVITQLMGENYDLRVKRRELEGKLPKEGSVVLSAEDAAKWEALKGYDPADVTKKLSERDTMEKELQSTRRKSVIAQAATLAKFNPTVLEQLAGETLTIEVVGEGDKAQAVVKDGQGASTPLADYAKANWSAFAPALATDPKAQGVNWVDQGGGGNNNNRPAQANAVDKRLQAYEERGKAPNALRPATGG